MDFSSCTYKGGHCRGSSWVPWTATASSSHLRPPGGRPTAYEPSGAVGHSLCVGRRSDADAEAGEPLQRDAGLVQHLLDSLLRVLGERLLKDDVLLEEAADAALDDP